MLLSFSFAAAGREIRTYFFCKSERDYNIDWMKEKLLSGRRIERASDLSFRDQILQLEDFDWCLSRGDVVDLVWSALFAMVTTIYMTLLKISVICKCVTNTKYERKFRVATGFFLLVQCFLVFWLFFWAAFSENAGYVHMKVLFTVFFFTLSLFSGMQ